MTNEQQCIKKPSPIFCLSLVPFLLHVALSQTEFSSQGNELVICGSKPSTTYVIGRRVYLLHSSKPSKLVCLVVKIFTDCCSKDRGFSRYKKGKQFFLILIENCVLPKDSWVRHSCQVFHIMEFISRAIVRFGATYPIQERSNFSNPDVFHGWAVLPHPPFMKKPRKPHHLFEIFDRCFDYR